LNSYGNINKCDEFIVLIVVSSITQSVVFCFFCSPWIVHYCPKYIEVRTCAVKYQFLGKSEMEMGLVDAVLRRFKQVDDELYMNQGPARWRHFVESDFMVCSYSTFF